MEYEETQWSRTDVAQRFALRVSGPALRVLSPAELDDTEVSLSWRVMEFEGSEGLDELYVYRVRLKRARGFDPEWKRWQQDSERVCGQWLTVHVALPGGGLEHRAGPHTWSWERGWRPISGIVADVAHLGWDDSDDEYELELRPWLYEATLRGGCRIYQDLDVRQILEQVLGGYPHRVQWRLETRYPKRDFQVQYHETDLEFFERLVQEWGIHYHFEHEVGGCELVLGDHVSAFALPRAKAYERLWCLEGSLEGTGRREAPRWSSNPECIEALRWCEKLVPGRWEGADYDYQHPRWVSSVLERDELPVAHGDLGGRHWRGHAGVDVAQPAAGHQAPQPGQQSLREQAQWLAQRRLQALRAPFERARGRGALRGMQPGAQLCVQGHWLAPCNDWFVVLGTRLRMAPPEGWEAPPWAWCEARQAGAWEVSCEFELHPSRTPLRPQLRQPKPSVESFQTAIVMGPTPIPGRRPDEPCVDELGRIRVRFAWDPDKPQDERASCWVRMSAPAAADLAGEVWVPRAGQEVVVSFLEGDCDTPVAVGALYSQANPPPWELPANAALSGVRTRAWSREYGGNCPLGLSNQLVFDDTPGQLQVQLASEQSRSQLSLGVLTELLGHEGRGHPVRGRSRGEGFELRSDGEGVVRAGRGLLLSTHARRRGAGAMLGMQEPLRLLRRAQGAWLRGLRQPGWEPGPAGEAQADEAQVGEAHWQREREAFARQLREHLGTLQRWNQQARQELRDLQESQRLGPQAPAQGEQEPTDDKASPPASPLLAASAGSLLGLSDQGIRLVAQGSLSLSAGGDVQLSAARRLLLSARRGLQLLARRAGLFLVARAGLVQLQAHQGDIHLEGREVLVESAEDWVEIVGDKELVAEFGNTRLRLSDEGIEIEAPAEFIAQASAFGFDGPTTLRRLLGLGEEVPVRRSEVPEPPGAEPAPGKPRRIVPVVFLPGLMGSNLRLSRQRAERLQRKDNRAWRPDDLLFTLSTVRRARPDERQLNFDPAETELERYAGTQQPGRFDARPADDARHDNVPSLPEVEPLLVRRPRPGRRAAFELAWSQPQRELDAGRKGRLRGWSEVHMQSYGQALHTLEEYLNTIRPDPDDPREPPPSSPQKLSNVWVPFAKRKGSYSREGLQDLGPAGVPPTAWGHLSAPASPLGEEELLGLADTLYPVHAMGYNWLQPNADSAREVASRIRELLAHYRELGAAQGVRCDHVLVYTHSMGGLVARALAHPDMGGLKPEELGGVCFGAMPTHGAGTAYKRMRAGMAGEGGWLEQRLIHPILGSTAREMVPVVANASGPLELFPAGAYGEDWLRVRWIDAQGQERLQVLDVQRAVSDPTCWWRVVHPEWINPAHQDPKLASFDATTDRLREAARFHSSLAQADPPQNSHGSFCNDPEHRSWGNVTWACEKPLPASADPDPCSWTLVHDDAQGTLRVRSGDAEFELKLQAPADAGDGTVPAERSGAKAAVRGCLWEQKGYEHQDSYRTPEVLSATLYAMVRMDQKFPS